MNLYTQIITAYPELTNDDFGPLSSILLRDDGDGVHYIARWEYTKPLPDGMKVGK